MKTRMMLSTLLIAVVLLLMFASVQAQSGDGYDLAWNTIDNGGGPIGSGGYTLNGTIGQPDASAPMSNGGYTLTGGFWNMTVRPYPVFLPLVLRGP